MSDIVIYGQDSSFLLAIDVNHPDDDLTPLPTDFIQVEPPAINPQKNSELHLLPLPTDFDPSAEPTELIIGAGNEHLSANDLESQSEEVIEALSTNSKDNPADHAEGGDGDHGAAVTARDDDPTLREILESLARTKGEEDGVDMAKKPVTGQSSHLFTDHS